ncbi:MAG TPA: hypothetical protein VF053_15800 [Streptosporangiales bacterium]
MLAALCHGSDRSWRDRYRAWPAFVVGVLVAVVICAAIGVQGAFHKQQRLDREEQQRQERATRIPTPPPTPTQQASTPLTTPTGTVASTGPSGGTTNPGSVQPSHSRHHRVHPTTPPA